ncbi:histidine kinase [Clostridium polyendosporum]|uniref:Histidine kinase n=2 Tax=Clostridium polyendosporum TaxID=69208 RepID=A0A919RYX4_9CLOT|nr:histidine kinase [Clostridium polyendosporum]
MNKIDNLVKILDRLNKGEPTQEVRKQALELVQDISPLELSMAEQKLIENGLHPEDLRNLCDIHMEVLKGELEKLKSRVKSGHVLDTMIKEHEEILKFLTKLEELNVRIQKMNKYDESAEEFNKLIYVIDNIIQAENHHQREERVLFAELEKRNITGPTRIMRMEHEDLRSRKHSIKELASKVKKMDFSDFKEQLNDAAKYVVFNLRDHIFKENHILYPTAIDSITEGDLWDEMKVKCDEIGYCPFTP